MKILILYYSGAGNTKFIASTIEKSLVEGNYIVNSIRLTEQSINSLKDDFGILFLGFPVIFRNAPELVYKAIERLNGKNRLIMVFHTKGLYSGNAFKYIHKAVMEKQFISKGFINLYMLGMDLLTYAIRKDSFLEKIGLSIHSRNIYQKINRFIDKMEKGKVIKNVHEKWYTFLDNLIVKPLEIKADNDHKDWIKGFNANMDECIKCMKCVEGCPRGNIKLTDHIIFGLDCDVCLYCINNCP
jgi:flavodoxin/Pyruvate/2-oxoacid:ferredoxin oxidoreductase delta subunit